MSTATLLTRFFPISISKSDENHVSSVVCFTDTICVGDNAESECVNWKASGECFRIFSISFINNFLALPWNWSILVCFRVFHSFNSVLAPNPTLTDDVDKDLIHSSNQVLKACLQSSRKLIHPVWQNASSNQSASLLPSHTGKI